MKVLITGATGLIGSELVSLFNKKGINVHYLTTSKDKIINRQNYQGFYWNPDQGIIDENALIGVDAIIHLAGASISGRWTDSYKQEIIESRIFSANLLYKILKHNPHQVKHFISASGIGIYADSLTNIYTEDSKETDKGFLGRVVQKWEGSIDKFKSLGIIVCKLRTGLVLSANGGALSEMAKPVRMGLGASFGSGRQFQSWIHIKDLASMYLFVLENSLEGIYNAVAPNPVKNEMLVKEIAKALDKPLVLPNIPKFLMNMILGEMHQLLFISQNVSADKITAAGFKFKFETAAKAVSNILANKKALFPKTELS